MKLSFYLWLLILIKAKWFDNKLQIWTLRAKPMRVWTIQCIIWQISVLYLARSSSGCRGLISLIQSKTIVRTWQMDFSSVKSSVDMNLAGYPCMPSKILKMYPEGTTTGINLIYFLKSILSVMCKLVPKNIQPLWRAMILNHSSYINSFVGYILCAQNEP